MQTNHREKLSGVFPPCMTVFDGNEEVDYEGIARNVERYNETRLKGYMPLGSNGEFRSLSDAESVRIVEVYERTMARGKTLIAGVGRESAKITVEFIKRIADKGVDYATVLPPFYFVNFMTDDALIRYYTRIADESPVPVMMYNAPKFAAGLTFSTSLVATLAAHPNIVGMKDTSKEDIAVYIDAVPKGADFCVMAGSIEKFYSGLLKGAIGGVLSIANYLPDLCCRLQELHEAGKRAEAEKLDLYARGLSKNAAGNYGVAGVKAAMDLLGYRGGNPRNPLLPLADEARAKLKAVLKQEGLL
ncbi:MAG: dihydrodipicolinate synthase family protein [Deltaproteobacteria bacterium]|nr:dihydrodipicolinate synthase family protein [Deltaproteobacteria bacterium]